MNVQRCALHCPVVDGGQVNRSQLLNELAEQLNKSRKEADEILTSLTDLITSTVATGEDVAISGFAKFRRIDRPARMARNPATGEQEDTADCGQYPGRRARRGFAQQPRVVCPDLGEQPDQPDARYGGQDQPPPR